MIPSFSRPKLPEGLSFEIDELIMLRNWAENNALRLRLDLGHTENSRQFEEFVHIAPPKKDRSLVTIWRTRHAVMVTPENGETLLFFSMAQALAALYLRGGVLELRQNGVAGGRKLATGGPIRGN